MARTVLLADDSVTAQNMGRRILMDAGYEVITVNNGSAALKKIHESKPDLIVLDVYMPGYGGLEVCQRLKENEETQKIPVLLTVGKMEPFKTDEAKRVKADAHIVKPFDASELLTALTKLEDRIVPSSEGRGKSKPKKARIWHSEDPAKNFDDSNTDQIAYLEEVKKRHAQSAAAENPEHAAEPPAPEPVASIIRPAGVGDPESAAPPVQNAVAEESGQAEDSATLAAKPVESVAADSVPAPEFSVEQESAVEFQAEPATTIEPAPLEPVTADAMSTSASEAAPAVENKSRWVAENVALSAEEASLELDREMQSAVIPEPATDAAPAPPTIEQPAIAPEVVAEQPSPEAAGSAFAAAASAGNPATAVSASPAESAPEAPAPSEAAAAWENWQHIRDSVMAPQTTEALAASVAEIAQAAAPALSEASVTEAPSPETTSDASISQAVEPTQSSADSSALEGEALASIVDSVLAELKPKLMEQIAKKLKSEKK